jgi:uncharacterized protein (DUF1697 family)
MTTWIALLRGVNVGGHKPVAMSDLRDLLAKMGFADPRTLLQSGNLVFGSDATTGAGLERRLEAEAAKRLGVQTDFMVRSAREWSAIVARNPFPEEAKRDPGHLLALVLKESPTASAVKAIEAAITGRETVRADGKQLYAVYPDGVGRSRLTISLIEKKLGTCGTGRNWNTVLKLAALAGA